MTQRNYLVFATAAVVVATAFPSGCSTPMAQTDATQMTTAFYAEEGDFTSGYLEECKRKAKNNDSEAQALYGMALLNGWGVKKDAKSAFRWIKKSAEADNPIGQMLLGDCLRNGIVVEKDVSLAVEFYFKAAAQSHPSAQKRLGFLYRKGVGVDKD